MLGLTIIEQKYRLLGSHEFRTHSAAYKLHKSDYIMYTFYLNEYLLRNEKFGVVKI